MSKSLNKVQLIGNLGADPEVRFTQDGRPIASLRLATTDTWTDKQGQRQERTEWHAITIFGKLAEIAQQYLRKGSKVYVEGQLQTDTWTDRQGMERYTTKVVLSPFKGEFIMLDNRGGGGGGVGGAPGVGGYGAPPVPPYAGPQGGADFQTPSYAGAPVSQPARGAPAESTPKPATDPNQTPDFDDDIPF